MLKNNSVLAIVPARSGSKGIPNKNMRRLLGTSLIGWAGKCLSKIDWIDAKIISTDSILLAEEGNRFDLQAPFLRPDNLASDTAGAVETMLHALVEAEKYYETEFSIILILEPTSPLRIPDDIEAVTLLLIDSNADSVVAVSPLDPKWHPKKVLGLSAMNLEYYSPDGYSIVNRQSLETLYWRNGVCYALTRECLFEKKVIISKKTKGYVINREIINIDREIELFWAEALMKANGFKGSDR